MFTFSNFTHDNTKSTVKYIEPLSNDFAVTVNGREVPVYTCRISKYPLNSVWQGKQRPTEQTVLASFVNLVSDEPLHVDVYVKTPYNRAILKPYSKEIPLVERDGHVLFTLSENGSFVFEADSHLHCLYIFNGKPVPCDDLASVTHYFGPGIHAPGKITLRSNESVYLDKDALVFGCVYAEHAENIRIYGNGVLDDRWEERSGADCSDCYGPLTNGNLKFYDCTGLRIEGVLCRDSAIWCLNLFHCFDVLVDGVRIFGQWRYNTDGIDIVNCQNIRVRNSFIHSFDDTVTIKAVDRYADTNNVNIVTEKCVLWCDWGQACLIGPESYCREYRHIIFRDCDILRAAHSAMCVDLAEDAEMSDLLFENIRVEYNASDTKPQYQSTEEAVYSYGDRIATPTLFAAINMRWKTPQGENTWGVSDLPATPIDFTGIERSTVHDVVCRDISVFYDSEVPLTPEGKYNVRIRVESSVEDVRFRNITVSNVFVNGERGTYQNLPISVVNVDRFVLE